MIPRQRYFGGRRDRAASSPGKPNSVSRSRFNPISALYLPLIPTGSTTVVNGQNIFYPPEHRCHPEFGNASGRPELRQQQPAHFRYSQFDCSRHRHRDSIGNAFVHVPGHNYIGHWTHKFSPTTFSDVYFGRNYGFTTTGTACPGETAAFFRQLQQAGMSSLLDDPEQHDLCTAVHSG